MRATRAYINRNNLKYNIQLIRNLSEKNTMICLPVKADAYGHGAIEISKIAIECEVNYLAVATVSEAEALRQDGIKKPILLLGPVLPEEIKTISELEIETVISSEEELSRITSIAKNPIGLHLKIDTGMGRIGCKPSEAVKLAKSINDSAKARLCGTCTHFPVSDSSETSDIEFTKKQIKLFKNTIAAIEKANIPHGIIHAANSGAIINYPEAHFDMIRPGIISYGYLPGGKESLLNQDSIAKNLKPVMNFESKLMYIKKVSKGTSISYGRLFKTTEESWIGTIPVGYADGYPRKLSNKSKVFINGKLYPVAGTVCMDQLMVNLGKNLEVKLYDKVIIFGDTEGAPSAQDLAKTAETISYEILCGISKRVPRIII
ncbi:MAG: alanine racemase, partial [Spirochaetales bacterium]|nr:alanine racemase [Spirochaetales bacterium]